MVTKWTWSMRFSALFIASFASLCLTGALALVIWAFSFGLFWGGIFIIALLCVGSLVGIVVASDYEQSVRR